MQCDAHGQGYMAVRTQRTLLDAANVDQRLEDLVGIRTPEDRTRVVRLSGICPGILASMLDCIGSCGSS